MKHLPLNHFEPLLGACENAQERAILGVLYWGGLRRQEAVDLDVADVDLDRNVLWVHGKGGDEREVCLFPKLRSLLAEHLRFRTPADRAEPLFRNRDGNRINAKSVNRVFTQWCTRAKLAGLGYTPHSARHGIAVLLLQERFTPAQIQAHLGHRDPETTLQYLRSAPGSVETQAAVTPALGGVDPQASTINRAALSASLEQLKLMQNQLADAIREVGAQLATTVADGEAMSPTTAATVEPQAADGLPNEPAAETLAEGESKIPSKGVDDLAL